VSNWRSAVGRIALTVMQAFIQAHIRKLQAEADANEANGGKVKAIGKKEVKKFVTTLLEESERPFLWIKNTATNIPSSTEPGGYERVCYLLFLTDDINSCESSIGSADTNRQLLSRLYASTMARWGSGRCLR
jgi:hypothetical protein